MSVPAGKQQQGKAAGLYRISLEPIQLQKVLTQTNRGKAPEVNVMKQGK